MGWEFVHDIEVFEGTLFLVIEREGPAAAVWVVARNRKHRWIAIVALLGSLVPDLKAAALCPRLECLGIFDVEVVQARRRVVVGHYTVALICAFASSSHVLFPRTAAPRTYRSARPRRW